MPLSVGSTPTTANIQECSICYEPFDGTEVITPCGHLYCKTCIENFFIQPVRDATQLSDEQVQAGCRSCPMCRAVLQPGQVFRSKAIFRPKDPTPEAEEDAEEEEDLKPTVAEGSDRKGKKRMVSRVVVSEPRAAADCYS